MSIPFFEVEPDPQLQEHKGDRVLKAVPLGSHSSDIEYTDNPNSWSTKTLRHKAHFITKKPIFWKFLKEDILPALKELAVIYEQKTADKIIVLANDKDDTVITIPYFTRFSKEYPYMVRKKMDRDIKPILEQYNVFMHFSLSIGANDFMSLADAYAFLMKLWNRILTRLRKVFPNMFVVKTIELQKNGYPHLHVLLAGVRWINYNWIKKIKGMEHARPHFGYLHSNNYITAYNYILKYILKGFKTEGEDSDWNYIQRVIQWALFSRTYTTSRIAVALSLVEGKNNSNLEDLRFLKTWYILGILKISDLDYSDILTKSDFQYQKSRKYT